jgi:hypothetical protein
MIRASLPCPPPRRLLGGMGRYQVIHCSCPTGDQERRHARTEQVYLASSEPEHFTRGARSLFPCTGGEETGHGARRKGREENCTGAEPLSVPVRRQGAGLRHRTFAFSTGRGVKFLAHGVYEGLCRVVCSAGGGGARFSPASNCPCEQASMPRHRLAHWCLYRSPARFIDPIAVRGPMGLQRNLVNLFTLLKIT